MSGRATFTIVMSSSSMNTPVHTAMRVHHLLAMRPPDSQGLNHQLVNGNVMYGKPPWTRPQEPPLGPLCTATPGTCSGGPRHASSPRWPPPCPAAPTSTPTRRCSALGVEEPQSQQSLARMCGVSGTTMTSVAEALQTDGLVERVRNPADRRSYSLTRTTAGRAAVRRWAPHVRRARAAAHRRPHPRPGGAAPGAAHQAGRRPARRAHTRSAARQHRLPALPRAPAHAPRVPHRARARSASSPGTSARCAPSPPPARSPRATSASCSTSARPPSSRWSTTSRRPAWSPASATPSTAAPTCCVSSPPPPASSSRWSRSAPPS